MRVLSPYRTLAKTIALLPSALLGSMVASAQAPTVSGPQSMRAVSVAARRAVADSIASEFVRLYVDADTGRMIATHIRERARAGAYDSLADPRAFGDAVTSDLQSVNGDRHLYVSYSRDGGFDKPGKGGIVDDTGSTAPPPSTPRQLERARQDHWGLGRVDVLSGNVGYMKVNGFEGSQGAFDATSAALKYLEGTDAMIFDFRGMGGGSGEQSNFLISHFVGADTLPSLVISNRSSGTKRTRYTLAKVPGTRRPSVPIWILTDRGTASAGEDFSFVLKNLGRARIVGDRTAGAGHNNDFVDVGHGFGVSISYTRVADPRTGREWERVGVQPDARVDPREALTVAHAAALDSLSRSAPNEGARIAYAAKRDGVLALAHPRKIAAATLASYTGTYTGGRVVSLENGELMFRRNPGRPPRRLLALNDSAFVFEDASAGDVDVTFSRGPDGGMRMVTRGAASPPFVIARTGDVPAELAQ